MSELETHEAAKLFPILGEADLQELANDIAAHGLLQPVTLHEGKVLDGRNRLKACELASVEPRFEQWQSNGVSPTEWVISVNLKRRHLTTGQRAAIAVEALPLLETEARERQREAQRKAGRLYGEGHPRGSASKDAEPLDEPSAELFHGQPARSARIAGSMVGISYASVDRAKRVRANAPELFDQMKEGQITTTAAIEQAGLRSPRAPRREIDTPFDVSSQRNREIAGAAKRRVIDGLAHAMGLCKGLKELDYGRVAAISTHDEMNQWSRLAAECSTEFRRISSRIGKVTDNGE